MLLNIIFYIIQVMNIGTILYMIFHEKRSANSIISWFLIFNVAPAIGLIFFILIGRKINQKKMYKIKESDIKLYEKYIKDDIEKRINSKDCFNKENFNMISSLENMGYAPYREGNDVKLFSDGKEFFSHLIEDLKRAEKNINIQFYIFRKDGIGTEILEILENKAREGVEVRFLYDSVGCRTLNRDKLKDFILAGGKVAEFFPSKIKPFNINMNHRNHRKIVVIDNYISYVGGFNVGDEYLGKNPKFGYWRDSHVRITGPSSGDLNLRFLADWRYAAKEDIDFGKEVLNNIKEVKEEGNKAIQIVGSGPNENNLHEIKLSYVKMIQNAKRYVYIQTPYLIVDNSVSDSLKLAALGGADVRIMIPGKGDHPFVYWVNLSYAGELLKYGIKIYHYDKDAFLHAKTLVIDDSVVSIGTANMDTRSFELNFEVNAFIYSDEMAKEHREAFEKDLKRSKELTLEDYKKRSNSVKFKEGLSKLFSALL